MWSAVVCDGPSRGCCATGCEDGALGQCAVLLADQGGRAGEPTQRVSPGGVLTSSGGEGPATWGWQSLAPRVPRVGCDRLAGGFMPLQLPLASQAPGVRQGRDGPHTGATTEYLLCVRVQGKGGGGRGPNNVRGAELRVAKAGGREVWQAEGTWASRGAVSQCTFRKGQPAGSLEEWAGKDTVTVAAACALGARGGGAELPGG